MRNIIVEVGQTRIQTQDAALALQVLATASGHDPAAAPAASPAIPPAIGQYWPGQGGLYVGVMRGQDGQPDYHLVVAPAEKGEAPGITWGPVGEDETGAASEWDGQSNTAALVNANSHPAAEWAAGVEVDRHRDFYLPSRRELRLCWVNASDLFASAWYWSSTQCSPDSAWGQAFGVGNQDCYHECYELRARAVRRIPTSTL